MESPATGSSSWTTSSGSPCGHVVTASPVPKPLPRNYAACRGAREPDETHGRLVSSVDTAVQPAVARDQSRALFGQTMGLVAITAGLFALGAYLGRDLSYGWGFAAFIASFA